MDEELALEILEKLEKDLENAQKKAESERNSLKKSLILQRIERLEKRIAELRNLTDQS